MFTTIGYYIRLRVFPQPMKWYFDTSFSPTSNSKRLYTICTLIMMRLIKCQNELVNKLSLCYVTTKILKFIKILTNYLR